MGREEDTSTSHRQGQRPVRISNNRFAEETVVDGSSAGGPHQQDDPEVLELIALRCSCGALIPKDMTASRISLVSLLVIRWLPLTLRRIRSTSIHRKSTARTKPCRWHVEGEDPKVEMEWKCYENQGAKYVRVNVDRLVVPAEYAPERADQRAGRWSADVSIASLVIVFKPTYIR